MQKNAELVVCVQRCATSTQYSTRPERELDILRRISRLSYAQGADLVKRNARPMQLLTWRIDGYICADYSARNDIGIADNRHWRHKNKEKVQ